MSDVGSLAAMIDAAGLGPARVEIDQHDVIRVELDPDSPSKATTLLLWIELITVDAMVAGQYRASDRHLRLHLRGRFPSGSLVIVTAPFDQIHEAHRTALISSRIECQQPRALITALSEHDTTHR